MRPCRARTRSSRLAHGPDAIKSALKHIVDTFFDGSVDQVVAALLGGERGRLTDDELRRIGELVDRKRKAGSE